MNLQAFVFIAAALAVAAAPAMAEGPRIGQIKTATGEAVIQRENARYAAKPGDPVYARDVIETGDKGAIGISLIDNTVFSVGPNSQLSLDRFRFDAGGNEMLAEMRRGTLSVVSGEITKRSPGAMKIKTPTAVLGVRGTTFAVQVVGR